MMNFKSQLSIASLAMAGLALAGSASAQNASVDFTDCSSAVWATGTHGCATSGPDSGKLPASTTQFNSWVDKDSGLTVTPQASSTNIALTITGTGTGGGGNGGTLNQTYTYLAAGTSGNVWKWSPASANSGLNGDPAPGIVYLGSGTNETASIVVSDGGSSFELISFEVGTDKSSSVNAVAEKDDNSSITNHTNHPAYPAVPVSYTVYFCSDLAGCSATVNSADVLGTWTGTLAENTSPTGTPVWTLVSGGGYSGFAESDDLTFDVPGAGDLYLDTIDVQVPEGGAASMYLLLAGAVCFGAVFFKRNRVTA